MINYDPDQCCRITNVEVEHIWFSSHHASSTVRIEIIKISQTTIVCRDNEGWAVELMVIVKRNGDENG